MSTINVTSLAGSGYTPMPISSITSAASAVSQRQTYNIGLRGLMQDEVSPWATESGFVKKYEVVETSEDVLALSCAWHRMRKLHSDGGSHPGIHTLLQQELFSQVTPEDRTKADEVRDHYSKKLMVWKLKEKQLSRFREDLNLFVHDKSNKISEKLLPLVYRLPEFHEYDLEFDSMVREITKEFPTRRYDSSFIPKLTSLKKFVLGRSSNKRTEYWMKDQNDNLHLIVVQNNNPLKHLWDTLFDSKQIMTIRGSGSSKVRDGVQYREFSKWEIV